MLRERASGCAPGAFQGGGCLCKHSSARGWRCWTAPCCRTASPTSPARRGEGSGGPFVRGGFERGERRLELSLRHSLGGVVYHLGEAEMTHEQYMRRLLGTRQGNLYPGFSSHPLDGFRHLRHDLDRFAWDFVQGAGDEFRRLAEQADEPPRLPGAPR